MDSKLFFGKHRDVPRDCHQTIDVVHLEMVEFDLKFPGLWQQSVILLKTGKWICMYLWDDTPRVSFHVALPTINDSY